MNEFEREWVEVLKTTDLPQTKGMLHRTVPKEDNPVGYCCLGVAAKMAVERGIIESVIVDDSLAPDTSLDRIPGCEYFGEEKEYCFLPEEVAKALGDVESDPAIVIENVNFDENKPADTYYVDINKINVYRKNNPRYLVSVGVSSLNDVGLTFAQIGQLIEYAGGLESY